MRHSLPLNVATTAVLLAVEAMLFFTSGSALIQWVTAVGAVLAIMAFVLSERRRRRALRRVDDPTARSTYSRAE